MAVRSKNTARQRAMAALHGMARSAPANRARTRPATRALRPAVLRGMILVALWIALAVELVLAVFHSPWFEVRQVRVEGVKAITASEVQMLESAVRLPAGTNTFSALLKWRGKSAAKLPFVQRVQVRLAGLHKLTVRVRPRIPVAVVASPAGRWEVDGQGRVIRADRGDTRLPLVETAENRQFTLGNVIPDDAVLQVLQGILPAEGGLRVAKVHVDPQGNLCLNMVDGVEVQMGQPDQLNAKLRLLERIYREEPGIGSRVSSINLSCIEAPACTPRAAPSASGMPGNAQPQRSRQLGRSRTSVRNIQ